MREGRCYESRVVEPYSIEVNVLAWKYEYGYGTSGYQGLSPEAAQKHGIGQVEAPYLTCFSSVPAAITPQLACVWACTDCGGKSGGRKGCACSAN